MVNTGFELITEHIFPISDCCSYLQWWRRNYGDNEGVCHCCHVQYYHHFYPLMRVFRFLLLPLILLLHTTGAKAQTPCDCKDFYNLEKAFFQNMLGGNKDKMLLLYGRALADSSPLCKAYAVNLQARLAFFDANVDSARRLLQKEREMLAAVGCGRESYLYNERMEGVIAFQTGDHESAVRHIYEEIHIGELRKDTSVQIIALMNVGSILLTQKQHQQAMALLPRIERLITDRNRVGYYENIAELSSCIYRSGYEETGNLQYRDSLYVWAQRGVEFCRNHPSQFARLRAYQTMAYGELVTKNYKKAIAYCDSALITSGGNMHEAQKSSNYYIKSHCLNALGMNSAATIYADSAVFYAKRVAQPAIMRDAYLNQYEVAKSQGNYRIALPALEQKMRLDDSLQSAERVAIINNLELKYNKVKDEEQIAALSHENAIKELRIRWLATLGIGSLLIVLVMIILYRQKQLKNKHLVLEAEQRLNRARINPHFFFNALTSLQTYSMQPSNSAKVPQYLSKYSKIMRHTLESTYNELIPLEEELEYLNGYLEIESMRSNKPFTYLIDVDKEIDVSETMLPPMILQPFIENSIEHGFRDIEYEGVIQLSFILENNMLVITINDNGTSTPNTEGKGYPSRATQIIRDRLFLLNQEHKSNARFEVRNTAQHGYSVIVTLPLLQQA